MLRLQVKNQVQPIIPATDSALLCEEIRSIKDCLISEKAIYQIYLVDSSRIPLLLQEIGRLREVTFRQVGEGTGKSCDLDTYDTHYLQLFIWDSANKCLVGGYRLGNGAQIFSKFGPEGFYTNSLFNISKGFFPVLQNSLELGRSFVVPAYQRKSLPLYLLWSGILHYLLRNPECRYLIGPVSISNSYTEISKSLMVTFLKTFYFESNYSQFIGSRNPFIPRFDINTFLKGLQGKKASIKELEYYMSEIEGRKTKVPILIKKYIKQNARFIGFNIDPEFSNALDGLMMMDMRYLPVETYDFYKS